MKRTFILLVLLLASAITSAQELKLKKRKSDALAGTAFAKSISDTTLSLRAREELIFKEVKSGNVPSFLRKLVRINADATTYYYALPDYFAIGSDEDFFYCPMTPMLAQRIANLTKCMLPTKVMVDQIYSAATIKLAPEPIPPTKEMITVPVFLSHNELVVKSLEPFKTQHLQSALTAGNKKDIIISNKIYGEKTPRVVIYGWHKKDGFPIQPVYNKHTNTWADYSHGVRLIQVIAIQSGKKVSLKSLLKDPQSSALISNEGVIENAFYPLTGYIEE